MATIRASSATSARTSLSTLNSLPVTPSPRSHLPQSMKPHCIAHPIALSNPKPSIPNVPRAPYTPLRRTFPMRKLTVLRSLPPLAPTLTIRAASTSSSSSSSSGGRKESRWDPLLANSDVGCPVPPEQQPVNEYADLSDALFFSWGTMGPFNLSIRLAAIGLFFTIAVGFPISAASFDPSKQALQCVLSAIGGGLFPVALATVRLYLGWSYIGGRLSSATVEYEETGWYDGEIWVKTPELLARDRLLASYRVKPVLRRLRTALIGLGSSLIIISGLVAFLPSFTPTPELPPPPFEELNSMPADGMLFRIIRAEEKTYNPESARIFEGGPDEDSDDADVSMAQGGVFGGDSDAAEMFRRIHSLVSVQADEDAQGGSDALAAGYAANGYGFELLSGRADLLFELDEDTTETDADALFSRSEAKSVASDFSGVADVTILATRQEVEWESEDSFKYLEPPPEDLSVLGAGVRAGGKGSKNVRISDHLGVGSDSQLKVVRTLKAE